MQGRLTAKTYHDGKSIIYTYENTTSRLKEVTDAKGQKTQYSYYQDDNVKQITYSNALIATPSVAYTYESNYNRIATMSDGTGKTSYSYKKIRSGLGSGQLNTIDGPLSNDGISYTYDSLGRVSKRSINGTALSVVYDKLGRLISETNALGNFGYNYLNQTDRLSSMTYPNGQSTVYDYFDNKSDQRLKQIWNKTANNATLSKFDYEYDIEGRIKKWTKQSDASTPNYYELEYDLADQLISATFKKESTSAIVKRYAYQYDKAGNRTSEQIDNTVTSAVYNNLNQLTRRQDKGPIRVKGTVNEFSSVLVKNVTAADSLYAPVDSVTNSFEAFVKTVPGTNNITIAATDYSGNNNKKVNSYNITVGNGVNDTLAFDANGNTTTETNPAVTYAWDAADRLVKITKGGNVTEFVYDGLSRRVAEKLNGTVIKRWLWCGTELCEERDAGGGAVTKRFFGQGEQINGTNYYFTRDHLGSVIEMTDASGILKARFRYDPYGRRIKALGSIEADFGFTGHYYHAASGLYLTLYRAYDANVARWLNRDPIEEGGGLNLYGYVANNPTNAVDPYGLSMWDDFKGGLNRVWNGDPNAKGLNVNKGFIPGYGAGAAYSMSYQVIRWKLAGSPRNSGGVNWQSADAWGNRGSVIFGAAAGASGARGAFCSAGGSGTGQGTVELYHFTTGEGAQGIMGDGIINGSRGLWRPWLRNDVYFTTNANPNSFTKTWVYGLSPSKSVAVPVQVPPSQVAWRPFGIRIVKGPVPLQ